MKKQFKRNWKMWLALLMALIMVLTSGIIVTNQNLQAGNDGNNEQGNEVQEISVTSETQETTEPESQTEDLIDVNEKQEEGIPSQIAQSPAPQAETTYSITYYYSAGYKDKDIIQSIPGFKTGETAYTIWVEPHDGSGKHALLGWVTDPAVVGGGGDLIVNKQSDIDRIVNDSRFYRVGEGITFGNSDIKLTAVWAAKEFFYTVTYDPGTQGTFAPQTTQYLIYGDPTPAFNGTPTGNPGWTFTGWSPAVAPTVTGDATYVAQWEPSATTPYKVEHYTQNLDGTYKLEETENLTGKTGTYVTATPKTYAGFTHNPNAAGTIAGGTILADGSLVLKLYYDRNSYSVTYEYTGTVPAGASALPAKAEYKYGETVTVAAAATAPGYTFSGWDRQGAFNMPAEDVVIKGSFTANTDTPYTVKHYTENLDGTYTLADVENLTGTTDTTVQATPKSYTGFTFDNTVAGTVESGTIAGDGSLELVLYYTRNSYTVTYKYEGTVPAGASALPAVTSHKYGELVTVAPAATAPGYTFSGWDRQGAFNMPAANVEIKGSFTAKLDTPYKVEHYLQNLDNNDFTKYAVQDFQGMTGTTAYATPNSYTGFTFDSSVAGTVMSGTIAGDGSLVLKLYYTRNSYKVTYEYVGTVPSGASDLPAEKTYKYDELVMIAPKATAPAGYDFIGWNRTANFKMPAENVTIQGTFVARGDTPYTVEHYQQNLDGTGYNLVDTENLTGQTDAQAAAVPKAYAGFTFDSTIPGTIQTGTITGDGKLVLKLYYIRNAYNVVIHYVDIAGNTLAPDAVLTGIKVGQTFADIISPTVAGYTARNGFIRCPAGGMPAQNLEYTVIYDAVIPPGPTPGPTPGPVPPVPPTPPVAPDPGPGGQIVVNDGGAELINLPADETPLADNKLDMERCNLLALLFMLASLILIAIYAGDAKKQQKKLQELKEENKKIDQEM